MTHSSDQVGRDGVSETLRRGDLDVIAKVRRTSGGGYPSELIPKAKLKRLIDLGALRFKPCRATGDLSTPDEVWASRRAQAGYVIHGPNADAMLRARSEGGSDVKG